MVDKESRALDPGFPCSSTENSYTVEIDLKLLAWFLVEYLWLIYLFLEFILLNEPKLSIRYKITMIEPGLETVTNLKKKN